MMHDNYTPPAELCMKDGEPTENGFYIIYINIPCDSFKLSNAMLIQLTNGSYYHENTPEVNINALVKGRILKHIGPLPYRIK